MNATDTLVEASQTLRQLLVGKSDWKGLAARTSMRNIWTSCEQHISRAEEQRSDSALMQLFSQDPPPSHGNWSLALNRRYTHCLPSHSMRVVALWEQLAGKILRV